MTPSEQTSCDVTNGAEINAISEKTTEIIHQEEKIRIAAAHIREAFNLTDASSVPKIAIVLGSGLGDFPRILTDTMAISFNDIPHMPKVTVQGHDGQLIIGTIGGNNRIICFAGRVHSYEGVPWTQVCFQVQLMSYLGCKLFVLTNATGGLLDGMYEPCFMVIRDHIRSLARIDPTSRILSLDTIATLDTSRYEPQSPPQYWSNSIGDLAMQIARDNNVELFEGNYAWTSGPSYETPAEVMFMKKLGGGAVGMSTVPEVITAMSTSRGDLQVFGLSMVTNLGAGISVKHLTHEEVEQNARSAMTNFQSLVEKVVMEAFGKLIPVEEVSKLDAPSPVESDLSVTHTRQRDGNRPLKLSEIAEAIDLIKTTIGEPTVKSAFIVPTRRVFDDLLDQSTVKAVPLKDVKNFPFKSLAGNRATVFTGTAVGGDANQRILGIECLDVEGFGTRESAFLALLFSLLGIDNVLTTIHAESSTEDGKVMFGVMDDFINFSARTRSLKFLLPMVDDIRMTNTFSDEMSDMLHGDLQSSLPKHRFMSFSGPMRPSRSERAMAHMLGFDTVGVASLGLVYNLRFLNIHTLPIIMNSLDDVHKLATVVKNVLDISSLSSNSGICSSSSHQLRLMDPEMPLNTYVNLANLRNKEASDVVDYIGKCFGGKLPAVTLAIMDTNLGLDLQRRFNKILCSIPVRDLPHFSRFFQGTKNLTNVALELVQQHGNDVLCWIVRGAFTHENTEPAYACDVQLLVRVFQVLGVRQLVYCHAFLSLEESEDAVGRCAVITDHINFLGENPLIGHNDQYFGMRFPDMSECYNHDLNTQLIEHLNKQGLDVEKTTCFFTNSLAERHTSVVKKSAELRIAAREVAKCGVASSIGAKEMIVTRHMFADRRIRASMIGIATDSLADTPTGDKEQMLVEKKAKIVDALAHLWSPVQRKRPREHNTCSVDPLTTPIKIDCVNFH